MQRLVVSLLILMIALLPRVVALDAYVAPDEGKWIFRSAHFLQALRSGDLARATSVAATPEVEVLAPAVPTMWAGALGLLLKYWLDGSSQWGSLADYLQAIPEATEQIPLGFYPWTRLPMAVLASLAAPVIFLLLLKLLDSTAALLAALLVALDPFFLGLSRVIHHDAPVSIFIVISLLALLVARRQTRPLFNPWLLLSGLSLGLALLTKPTALYLVVFAGLFLLLEGGLPRRLSEWRQRVQVGLVWGLVAAIVVVVAWPALWAAPVDTLTDLWARSGSDGAEENNYSLVPAPGPLLPELGFLFYPVNWLFKSTLPELIGLAALVVALKQGWLAASLAGWTVKWLAGFVLLFWLLLLPADTRDIRYFLPGALLLYALAAAGAAALARRLGGSWRWLGNGLLALQVILVAIYYPYFVNYWNPVVGGPWLAPRLVKIGSGEGLDQVGRYLSQKPDARELTVATSFWESFVPFFSGHYTKGHYDDEADYILIYLRQIQNGNPFPEYWSYFSGQLPEYRVSLVGTDYAWLYPGPQLRVVRDVAFNEGLTLRGYRLDRPAARPGQPAHLTLVWAGATPDLAARPVTVRLADETGRTWAEATGPLLAASGPSPVEGHLTLNLPAGMPPGDYELWVSLDEGQGNPAGYKIGQTPVR